MKNRILNMVVAIGIIATIISCGNSKKEPEVKTVNLSETVATNNGDLNAVDEIAEASFEDQKLNEVYTAYLEVKAALVNTDADKVTTKGGVLLEKFKAVNAGEQALVAAMAIASNADIVKQREAFEMVTSTAENMLKEAIASGEIYKQFCPMAFDGRGAYWLSDSKEIRNPYFGNKMLKCGLVKETLK